MTDARLESEAQRYGAGGARPQVVWSNGVLASTAVGLVIQLIAPWFPGGQSFAYFEYDGNRGTVVPTPYMRLARDNVDVACPHHPADETGDPCFAFDRSAAPSPRIECATR